MEGLTRSGHRIVELKAQLLATDLSSISVEIQIQSSFQVFLITVDSVEFSSLLSMIHLYSLFHLIDSFFTFWFNFTKHLSKRDLMNNFNKYVNLCCIRFYVQKQNHYFVVGFQHKFIIKLYFNKFLVRYCFGIDGAVNRFTRLTPALQMTRLLMQNINALNKYRVRYTLNMRRIFCSLGNAQRMPTELLFFDCIANSTVIK